MSKPWLTYCWYLWNGHQKHTHTHTVIAIIHFHSYKVHTVHKLFTACCLFWSCSTQHQLWCLTKVFPLVFCLCVCVYVWCVCLRSQEGSNWLSPLHIQAISGLRSHKPCKQPPAYFPLPFSLCTFLPHPHHICLAPLAWAGYRTSIHLHVHTFDQNVAMEPNIENT